MEPIILGYAESLGRMLVVLLPIGLLYGKLFRKYHLALILLAFPVGAVVDLALNYGLPSLTNGQQLVAAAIACAVGIELSEILVKFSARLFKQKSKFDTEGKGKTGIILSTLDGCTINGVNQNSPAGRSGLLAGDWIVSVDGFLCGNDYVSNASRLIGPPGSVVRISVLRDGSTIDFDLIRSEP